MFDRLNKKPKLILHVGFHKTGTTSIQNALVKNESLLKKAGYVVPSFRDLNGRFVPNHGVVIRTLFDRDPEKFHVNIRLGINGLNQKKDYLKQLESYQNSKEDLILSGEGVGVLSFEGLEKLKIYFKGYNIIPICYVRNPYDFTCSMMNQSIKSGRIDSSPRRFLNKSDDALRLTHAFKEVRFFSFDEVKKYDIVEHYFEEVLGLPKSELKLSDDKNVGISGKLARLLMDVNLSEPWSIAGSANDVRVDFDPELIEFSKDKFFLTEDELTGLKSRFEDELAALNYITGLKLVNSYRVSEPLALTDEDIETISSKSHFLSSRLKGLFWQAMEPYIVREKRVESKISFFSEKLLDADFLIKTAELWENEGNINNALFFMEKAKSIRPNGPTVLAKILKYKESLGLSDYD